MTKREAKAVLVCQRRIIAALDSCARSLSGSAEFGYFTSYWGANIRSLASGGGYGSAPVAKALVVLQL